MTLLQLPPIVAAGEVITDSLGRSWDSAKHPRGRDGKFIRTFHLIRAFMSATDTESWMTGEVQGINDDGSIRTMVTATTDPNLTDPATGLPYVGHQVDVQPSNVESVNEKAKLDLDIFGKPKLPGAGAGAGTYDFNDAHMSNFAQRSGLNSDDMVAAGDGVEAYKDGAKGGLTDRKKYYAALYAKSISGDGREKSHEDFTNLMDELGVPQDVTDDTPDGMSGLQWLADQENSSRSPNQTKLDSDDWLVEQAPTSEGSIREATLNGHDDVRMAWFDDGTQGFINSDGSVEKYTPTDKSIRLAAHDRANGVVEEDAGPKPPEPEDMDVEPLDTTPPGSYDTDDLRDVGLQLKNSNSEYGEDYGVALHSIADALDDMKIDNAEALSQIRSIMDDIQMEADDADDDENFELSAELQNQFKLLHNFNKNLYGNPDHQLAPDTVAHPDSEELDTPPEPEDLLSDPEFNPDAASPSDPDLGEQPDGSWNTPWATIDGGKPDDGEKIALASYASISYVDINNHLRHGDPLSPTDEMNLNALRKLQKRSRLRESTVVYRGMDATEQDPEVYSAFLASLQEGAIIEDKAFFSTSVNPDIAKLFGGEEGLKKDAVIITIDVPAGSSVIDVDGSLETPHETESELIFSPGTKFQIHDITTDEEGTHHVTASIVQTTTNDGTVEVPETEGDVDGPGEEGPQESIEGPNPDASGSSDGDAAPGKGQEEAPDTGEVAPDTIPDDVIAEDALKQALEPQEIDSIDYASDLPNMVDHAYHMLVDDEESDANIGDYISLPLGWKLRVGLVYDNDNLPATDANGDTIRQWELVDPVDDVVDTYITSHLGYGTADPDDMLESIQNYMGVDPDDPYAATPLPKSDKVDTIVKDQSSEPEDKFGPAPAEDDGLNEATDWAVEMSKRTKPIPKNKRTIQGMKVSDFFDAIAGIEEEGHMADVLRSAAKDLDSQDKPVLAARMREWADKLDPPSEAAPNVADAVEDWDFTPVESIQGPEVKNSKGEVIGYGLDTHAYTEIDNGVTTEMADSVALYSLNNNAINATLRGDQSYVDPKHQDVIHQLDQLLQYSHTKQDMQANRTVQGEEDDAHMQALLNAEPGDVIHDSGFSGMTTKKYSSDTPYGNNSPTKKRVHLKVNIPEGSRAVFVPQAKQMSSKQHWPNAWEDELITDREGSFEIVSVEDSDDPKTEKVITVNYHEKEWDDEHGAVPEPATAEPVDTGEPDSPEAGPATPEPSSPPVNPDPEPAGSGVAPAKGPYPTLIGPGQHPDVQTYEPHAVYTMELTDADLDIKDADEQDAFYDDLYDADVKILSQEGNNTSYNWELSGTGEHLEQIYFAYGHKFNKDEFFSKLSHPDDVDTAPEDPWDVPQTPADSPDAPLADWEKELLGIPLENDDDGLPGPESDDWEKMVDPDKGEFRYNADGKRMHIGDIVIGADNIAMQIKKFEKNNAGVIAHDDAGKKRIRHRKKLTLVEPDDLAPESKPEPAPAPKPKPELPDLTFKWDEVKPDGSDFTSKVEAFADALEIGAAGTDDYLDLGDGFRLTGGKNDSGEFEELTVHNEDTGEIVGDWPLNVDPSDIQTALNKHKNPTDQNEPGTRSQTADQLVPDAPPPNTDAWGTWVEDALDNLINRLDADGHTSEAEELMELRDQHQDYSISDAQLADHLSGYAAHTIDLNPEVHSALNKMAKILKPSHEETGGPEASDDDKTAISKLLTNWHTGETEYGNAVLLRDDYKLVYHGPTDSYELISPEGHIVETYNPPADQWTTQALLDDVDIAIDLDQESKLPPDDGSGPKLPDGYQQPPPGSTVHAQNANGDYFVSFPNGSSYWYEPDGAAVQSSYAPHDIEKMLNDPENDFILPADYVPAAEPTPTPTLPAGYATPPDGSEVVAKYESFDGSAMYWVQEPDSFKGTWYQDNGITAPSGYSKDKIVQWVNDPTKADWSAPVDESPSAQVDEPVYDSAAELTKINDIPKAYPAAAKLLPVGSTEHQIKQYRNASYALSDAADVDVDSPEWHKYVSKAIYNLEQAGPSPVAVAKLNQVKDWRDKSLAAKSGVKGTHPWGDEYEELPAGWTPTHTYSSSDIYDGKPLYAVEDENGQLHMFIPKYSSIPSNVTPLESTTTGESLENSGWKKVGDSGPDEPTTQINLGPGYSVPPAGSKALLDTPYPSMGGVIVQHPDGSHKLYMKNGSIGKVNNIAEYKSLGWTPHKDENAILPDGYGPAQPPPGSKIMAKHNGDGTLLVKHPDGTNHYYFDNPNNSPALPVSEAADEDQVDDPNLLHQGSWTIDESYEGPPPTGLPPGYTQPPAGSKIVGKNGTVYLVQNADGTLKYHYNDGAVSSAAVQDINEYWQDPFWEKLDEPEPITPKSEFPEGYAPPPSGSTILAKSKVTGSIAVKYADGTTWYHKASGATIKSDLDDSHWDNKIAQVDSDAWVPWGEGAAVSTPEVTTQKSGPSRVGADGKSMFVGDKVIWAKDGSTHTVKSFENNDKGVIVIDANGKKRALHRLKLTLHPDSDQKTAPSAPAPSTLQPKPPTPPAPIIHKPKPMATLEVDPDSPWYGEDKKPAKPDYPDQLSPDSWVPAGWLEKAKAHWTAHTTNVSKGFENTIQYQKWLDTAESGSLSQLESLNNEGFVPADMYQEAKDSITKINGENQIVQDEYNKKLQDYSKDLHAWHQANGIDPMAFPGAPQPAKEPFLGGAADWTKSHQGTPSAEAVLDAMRFADGPLARRGSSIMTDSDDIEDLDVRVNRVIDADGQTKLMAKFKVTHTRANMIETGLSSKATKTTGVSIPQGQVDPTTGFTKYNDLHNKYSTDGYTWTMTDPDSGISIKFMRSTNDQHGKVSPNALHNQVHMMMPEDTTPAQYESALKYFGISSAAPAAPEDVEMYAMQRLAAIAGGNTDPTHNETGQELAHRLQQVQMEYGISIADVRIGPDQRGRIKMFLSDAARDKIMQKVNVKAFVHGMHDANDLDVWEGMLSPGNSGLVATSDRWEEGIGGTGMSQGADMSTGGADYSFFHVSYDEPKSGSVYGGQVVVHPAAALRRLDVHANYGDGYGKHNSNMKVWDVMNSSPHEVIFKNGVPVSDIWYVALPNDTIKQQLIQRLKNHGIDEINGIPVEDFILTPGQSPPSVDPSMWSTDYMASVLENLLEKYS